MGMLYRRYHAATAERINKNEALEEAKQQVQLQETVKDEIVETPASEKRKYTKRIKETE